MADLLIPFPYFNTIKYLAFQCLRIVRNPGELGVFAHPTTHMILLSVQGWQSTHRVQFTGERNPIRVLRYRVSTMARTHKPWTNGYRS